jgi:hypothetical protein
LGRGSERAPGRPRRNGPIVRPNVDKGYLGDPCGKYKAGWRSNLPDQRESAAKQKVKHRGLGFFKAIFLSFSVLFIF